MFRNNLILLCRFWICRIWVGTFFLRSFSRLGLGKFHNFTLSNTYISSICTTWTLLFSLGWVKIKFQDLGWHFTFDSNSSSFCLNRGLHFFPFFLWVRGQSLLALSLDLFFIFASALVLGRFSFLQIGQAPLLQIVRSQVFLFVWTLYAFRV
jgi:hypothetical protein